VEEGDDVMDKDGRIIPIFNDFDKEFEAAGRNPKNITITAVVVGGSAQKRNASSNQTARCTDCGKALEGVLCRDCFDERAGIEVVEPRIEEVAACDRCGAKADSFMSGHLLCQKCYKEAERLFGKFVQRKK
jgi:hypothetical protein